jgi:hypothetical protein
MGSLFALAACGGGSGDGTAPGGELGFFIAYAPDFELFRSWEAFHLPDSSAQDPVHLAGPKTDYLNKRPPPGSSEFPVGTIIVKEIEVGPMEDRQVFAMVKRGGGYNAAGAPGWEWFELANNPNGSLNSIKWHGLGPPAGEMYGGDPNGCVGCHAAGKTNDYVQSPPLLLSNF